MPDADGRFRGISVPRLPWRDPPEVVVPHRLNGMHRIDCPGCNAWLRGENAPEDLQGD